MVKQISFPMICLAFDTSTDTGSVALLRDEVLLAETTLRAPMKMLSWLVPAIQEIIKTCGIRFEQIDRIAVGVGPGSFTGVRLQLATARTLAQIRKIPLHGISSLETLAFQTLPHKGYALSCIDARGGELFYAIFRTHGQTFDPIGDSKTGTVEQILSEVEKLNGPLILVGEQNPYKSIMLEKIPQVVEANSTANIVHASSLGLLAQSFHKTKNTDLYSIHPLYLRASSAERLKPVTTS